MGGFAGLLDKIKTGLLGSGQRVQYETDKALGGVGSFYQQTEPNIVQRIGTLLTGQQFQPTQPPQGARNFDKVLATAQPAATPVPQQVAGVQAPVQTPAPTPMPTAIPNGSPYDQQINDIFGELAPQAFRTLKNENARLDPKAENRNSDGSIDRGIFQINQNSFDDLMRRLGSQVQDTGASTFDDLYNPEVNIALAKLLFDDRASWGGSGWDAWYGAPQDIISPDELARRKRKGITLYE